MTTQQNSSLPAWVMPLIALAVTIVTNLLLFSYYTGQRAEAEKTQTDQINLLLSWKAKTEQRSEERLYEYEKQKAAKYAEMEEQIERLKNMPAPR